MDLPGSRTYRVDLFFSCENGCIWVYTVINVCMYICVYMYVCMEFREGQYKFYPIVFMYPCKYESYTIVNFS